jgi:GAF domain-containing protein
LHPSDAAMMDQDIKDASSARDDYALQQSVIASLSQQALLGAGLRQLFDDATRRARETLGVSRSKLMELQSDHDTLVGRAGSGWDAEVVRTIVAKVGACSHAGYALAINAPVIVPDFGRERRLRCSIAERWGLQSGSSGGHRWTRTSLRRTYRPRHAAPLVQP